MALYVLMTLVAALVIYLSLPKTKSGGIDDASRRARGLRRSGRIARMVDGSVRLCLRTNVSEPRCSRPCRHSGATHVAWRQC